MKGIYQHFRKEEAPLIDQISDMVRKVDNSYQLQLTNFLNPRERYIAQSLVGQWPDIQMQTDGGIDGAERQRVLIIPPFIEVTPNDFALQTIEIDYPEQFARLSHGSILGSLMGSGIRREMIGDIITDGTRWQFFADELIASFLIQEVNQIGKHSVIMRRVSRDEILEPSDHWQSKTIIVASLRLDTVLSRALNLSRQAAKDLIKANRVKVNWEPTEQDNFECEEYDMISVRGFGRLRLGQIQGETKKENQVLAIDWLKS